MALHLEGKLRAPIGAWLATMEMTPVFEVCHAWGLCDVVGVKWFPRISRRRPLIEKLIYVELKLDDVAGVLRQGKNNRFAAHLSYCAMPVDRIQKMRESTRQLFLTQGVGLLSCSTETVRVVVPAEENVLAHPQSKLNTLWRRRVEWRSRMGAANEAH